MKAQRRMQSEVSPGEGQRQKPMHRAADWDRRMKQPHLHLKMYRALGPDTKNQSRKLQTVGQCLNMKRHLIVVSLFARFVVKRSLGLVDFHDHIPEKEKAESQICVKSPTSSGFHARTFELPP